MTPTLDLDFGSLGLKDALDLAVLVEEEARERYEELADQMEKHDTSEAARFFVFMQRNEEAHRVELAARRKELFGDEPSDVTRSMLFDVEAPEYHQVGAFMTPRQALHVALRAEEKAWAFFDEALPHLRDDTVRALFEELRAEEVRHQDLVKAELAELPPDPGFDPGDLADEPVGQ